MLNVFAANVYGMIVVMMSELCIAVEIVVDAPRIGG